MAQPARGGLSVLGGLVRLVADRLELERAVRDVEMAAEALAQPVQHLTGPPLRDAVVIDYDMGGHHRHPHW